MHSRSLETGANRYEELKMNDYENALPERSFEDQLRHDKMFEQFCYRNVVQPGTLRMIESSETRVVLDMSAAPYSARALINWCGFGPGARVIRRAESVEVLA